MGSGLLGRQLVAVFLTCLFSHRCQILGVLYAPAKLTTFRASDRVVVVVISSVAVADAESREQKIHSSADAIANLVHKLSHGNLCPEIKMEPLSIETRNGEYLIAANKIAYLLVKKDSNGIYSSITVHFDGGSSVTISDNANANATAIIEAFAKSIRNG